MSSWQTHVHNSICTNALHMCLPLMQMECACLHLPAAHGNGDARVSACSPAIFAAWLQTVHGPEVGDPCFTEHKSTNVPKSTQKYRYHRAWQIIPTVQCDNIRITNIYLLDILCCSKFYIRLQNQIILAKS